jgi:hypothetical protein
MMLVIISVVVLLLLYSVAYRHTAAALRVETARVQQRQRDEGTMYALARAIALLETGLPPSDPYVCGVTINTPTGPSPFIVTFSSEGGPNWSVNARPPILGEDPDPMPISFAP